ncbi:MAG: hypothetical protein ACKV0T_09220 [Planctomycetales bacterium]
MKRPSRKSPAPRGAKGKSKPSAPRRGTGRPPSGNRPAKAVSGEAGDDDAPDDVARLKLRRLNRDHYALLEPVTAIDRMEDIDEVHNMIDGGELEIARDELLYLVSDCRGFLEAHNLLGELALEEGDIPLAQGHYGFAYEIGLASLPPGFQGRLPADKEYNGAFFLSGRGVARCLIARGQRAKGREVLELLARLDPEEPHVRDLLHELAQREKGS